MDIKSKNRNCRINFDKMISQGISTKESLKGIVPFEISNNVKSGKSKVIVDISNRKASNV